MAFRYLIYRTDFGNTIVRESVGSSATGGTEQELFTDFVIPELQPLYLWRVTGGTSVVPNTESNINDWLENITPIDPDDPVDFATFTGYTASTEITINNIEGDIITLSGDVITISGDVITNTNNITTISGDVITNTNNITTLSGDVANKIDKVTGATVGNVPIFVAGGNLEDSGFDIADLTGSTGGVTNEEFTGYTATTEVRLQGIEEVTDVALTGATNGLTKVGVRDVKLGGPLTENTTITGNGFDFNLNDLDQFTLSFSGISTITDSGSNGGLRYAADYAAQFVNRSLVDKGYVDAVAAGADWKESCRAATTTGETDIDLTGGTFTGATIDGYVLVDGDRILIKNQDSNQEQNGIYIWSASTSTFFRAPDFDGTPVGEVTAGAVTYIETGTTNGVSSWVLVTNDPITIDVTPLVFSLFSNPSQLTAGVGIDITNNVISFDGGAIAGNFLEWTGTLLNVTGLTPFDTFTGYTASTEIRLTNIETDITTLSGQVTTNTTNIGIVSGQTDINTTNITTLSGDVENLFVIVSGLTANTVSFDTFTGYTASTDVRITNIENDLSTVSAQTDINTTNISTISGDVITLSGEVQTLNDAFTGYTASTVSNELFILHTGGTELNTVIPTEIVWHTGITVGSAYTYTGGTILTIVDAGEYEITYNLPFNQSGSNNDRGVGGNLVVNGNIIDLSATAAWTSRRDAAGSLSLATVNYTFAANDKLTLVTFRTAQSGSVVSSPNGSLLIKKKNTLQ